MIEDQCGCDVFLADAYWFWQKWTDVNLNGLLREYFPKGRNLSRVSRTTLKNNPALINAEPKKLLGFKKRMICLNCPSQKCCILFDNSSLYCIVRFILPLLYTASIRGCIKATRFSFKRKKRRRSIFSSAPFYFTAERP